MLRANWRQEVDADLELARQANHAATKATHKVACLSCGKPALVWLRCDAVRFSAPVCDSCATFRMDLYAISRAAVTLDRIVGVPAVTAIESIDLAQFAREILDCAIGNHDTREVQNIPDATKAAMTALSARLRRPLLPSEQLALGLAVHAAFYARRAEFKALLRDTQTALHSPGRAFA